jgi:hypothetical protein
MNSSALAVLQREQQLHDERAHLDILGLSPERRITHMALHFAKYTGRLIEMQVIDWRALERVIVDATIICLASANTLNMRLEHRIEGGALGTLDALLETYKDRHPSTLEALPMWMGAQMAVHNAKIAKACEAFDHAEQYPYEQVLTMGVVELLDVCLAAAGAMSLDLTNAIRTRWAGVEKKLQQRAA